MIVYCKASECSFNNNGECQKKSILMKDVEEKENIKFKDNDFMICVSFEWRK
ncbi:hypothetical protein [Clostridium beijerinckii]|uniref:hypothetical protein n=1 Tax=Clostridium beijerinckii TaxID=1520 RepID=UPI001494A3FA|nr:hypothetical protein [Clostridium beijerinckii]NOW08070.1 hypothetical protein [Clostridium beijerinckii]NYC05654.1 hypothetical protein [Clostridium beijerinckii]